MNTMITLFVVAYLALCVWALVVELKARRSR